MKRSQLYRETDSKIPLGQYLQETYSELVRINTAGMGEENHPGGGYLHRGGIQDWDHYRTLAGEAEDRFKEAQDTALNEYNVDISFLLDVAEKGIPWENIFNPGESIVTGNTLEGHISPERIEILNQILNPQS